MNFRSVILFLAGSLFFLPSCENDFELTADWELIPVVYGLINPQDTAHYIRVEKAFLDPKIDAVTIANNPDSLYFDKVTVQIERVGATTDTYTLEEVDGNLEGYARDTGTFANAPNILYKLKLTNGEGFMAGDVLNLKVSYDDNEDPITASTIVSGAYELANPIPRDDGREIGFLPDNDSNTRWRDDAHTSFLFDVKYYIHYRERVEDNSPFENKVLEWEVTNGFEVEDVEVSSLKFDFESNEFYLFLKSSLPVIGSAIRRMDSINVEIFGAGEEVLEYIKVGRANSGITSSQVIPTYTNLSAGRGIFSSSGYLFESGFKVSQSTKEALETDERTVDLNFR